MCQVATQLNFLWIGQKHQSENQHFAKDSKLSEFPALEGNICLLVLC